MITDLLTAEDLQRVDDVPAETPLDGERPAFDDPAGDDWYER